MASIVAGAATGAAAMTAGVLILRAVQSGGAHELPRDAGFVILGVSLFTGIVIAVASGWLRAKPIGEPYRRGVIGALSVFGAFLLALLATAADMVGGVAGLTVYLAALVAGLTYAHGAAARAGRGRPQRRHR